MGSLNCTAYESIEIEIMNVKIVDEKYGFVNSYMRLKMIYWCNDVNTGEFTSISVFQ